MNTELDLITIEMNLIELIYVMCSFCSAFYSNQIMMVYQTS